MSRTKYDEFYSKISVSELFEKLRGAVKEPTSMEKDWYDALIIHLKKRYLSKEDERILESILPAGYTPLGTEEESVENEMNEANKPNKNYKVVPFNPSDNVSQSLQSIIDSHSINGWEYVNHQYSDKLKPGSTGCFGLGATPDSIIHIGVVVFKKK